VTRPGGWAGSQRNAHTGAVARGCAVRPCAWPPRAQGLPLPHATLDAVCAQHRRILPLMRPVDLQRLLESWVADRCGRAAAGRMAAGTLQMPWSLPVCPSQMCFALPPWPQRSVYLCTRPLRSHLHAAVPDPSGAAHVAGRLSCLGHTGPRRQRSAGRCAGPWPAGTSRRESSWRGSSTLCARPSASTSARSRPPQRRRPPGCRPPRRPPRPRPRQLRTAPLPSPSRRPPRPARAPRRNQRPRQPDPPPLRPPRPGGPSRQPRSPQLTWQPTRQPRRRSVQRMRPQQRLRRPRRGPNPTRVNPARLARWTAARAARC
jgi:hypothetical protein